MESPLRSVRQEIRRVPAKSKTAHAAGRAVQDLDISGRITLEAGSIRADIHGVARPPGPAASGGPMSDRGVGFSLRPIFEGTLSAARIPDDYFERIQHRVADGLFVTGRRSRANYRVTSADSQMLIFEAADFATAYAIGLNRVELRRAPAGIAYQVSFRRWSRFAVWHGARSGLALAAAYLLPAVRYDVEAYPNGSLLFWSTVLFWSLAWPRILTAIHRPFACKTLERILQEELETPRLRAAS